MFLGLGGEGMSEVRSDAKEELKSCPFCGGTALELDDDLLPSVGLCYNHWVCCIPCEIEGPRGATREEAIEKWNTRAKTKIPYLGEAK